jgi:TonB-dependent starch-binding outer membrane protein SusC
MIKITNQNKFKGNFMLSLTLFLALFSLSTTALAQFAVQGTVLGADNEPLVGVSILEKETSNGVITDVDGKFSISVANGNATLVMTYLGYETQEIAVANQSNIDVTLQSADLALEEAIVVGYGTQKKVSVTGAIAQLKGDKLLQSPAVDLSNSLSGRLPGLVVIQTNGEPGYDGAFLRIRGTNTLGNSSPLVVIDGIPDRDGGLGRLSPRDVESVSILKDASAAIYGARAANGVILVTTKRGAAGKTKVSYDFNAGIAQPTVVPKMSSATQYAEIMNELSYFRAVPSNEWGAAAAAVKASGSYKSPTAGVPTVNAPFSPTAIQKHGDGSDPWGYPNTDWFGDAFNTWTPQNRHNLQISGGTDKLKFMTSLGFVNQDAIYKNSATNYKQYNIRTNLDVNVNKYITSNFGLMLRREDRNFPTESSGAIFRMLMRGRPTEPEVWPNGLAGPDIENGQNPYVITTNKTGYVDNPADLAQLNGSVSIGNPWVDGLKLTLSTAIDRRAETNRTWQTPWELYFWDKVSKEADGTPKLSGSVRSLFTDPRLTQSNFDALNTNLTAIVNYDKVFNGKHNFNTLVGVTKEESRGTGFFAYRRNFLSPVIDQLFAGGTIDQNTGGSAYNRARLGYYGKVQYGYGYKYLAEFVWRYDGSYIFPKVGRFGFFPGISVGWNVTQEDFFKVPAIDNLKIRASYGQLGNDQVYYRDQLQEYAFLSSYGFGQYPIDNKAVTTLRETILANPDFTWEVANNYNVGIDATLFKNLDVTFEYFLNRRTNILIQKSGSTPASSGINSLLPPVNAGKVDNRGVELGLTYNGKKGSDLWWSAGVNGGYAKNKVVFMDETPGIPANQKQEGKPIGAFMVYNYTGVFKDQAEIDANKVDYKGVTGKLLPGDMKFEDVDGNGKIDAEDQVRLDKNTIPTLQYGATFSAGFKNLDFNLLFQGARGNAIRVQTESGDIGNYLEDDYNNRWSVANPSSEHPRLASRGDTYFTGGNFGNNTYYLRDVNYLRLKNIELGYTANGDFLRKAGISSFRFFVNGLNVLTFDTLKIFDPETVNGSGVYYPQSRVFNGGLTLNF